MRTREHCGVTRIEAERLPQFLKLCVALVAAAVTILAEQPRTVTADEAVNILRGGVHVRVGTYDKRTIAGNALQATSDGVTVQTGNRETQVAMKDIDWFRVSTSRSNKRTWLPLVLCATAGTAALVAAGATEEKKSTYLPLAAGLTAGLGVGGYYAGRAIDYSEVTYRIR